MFSEISLNILTLTVSLKIGNPQNTVKVCLAQVFYEQNSNSNLRGKRLTKFAIAWPKKPQISKCIAKKPLMIGIPER